MIKTIWYIQLLASFRSFWILQISNICYWNLIPSSLEIGYSIFGNSCALCIGKNQAMCILISTVHFWQNCFPFWKKSHKFPFRPLKDSMVRRKCWYLFIAIRNLINDYRWLWHRSFLYSQWNWMGEVTDADLYKWKKAGIRMNMQWQTVQKMVPSCYSPNSSW